MPWQLYDSPIDAPAASAASSIAGLRHTLGRIRTALLNAWLPDACMACRYPAGHMLCDACAVRFLQAEASITRCARCGIRTPTGAAKSDEPCGQCRVRPRAFDATIALADYRPPLDALAIALKFHGRAALARPLATCLADCIRMRAVRRAGRENENENENNTKDDSGADDADQVHRFDLILPAPLSTERLAQRGYNQAWEVARHLGRELQVDAEAWILSRDEMTAQSTLRRRERERNLRHAVRLSDRMIAPARRESRFDATRAPRRRPGYGEPPRLAAGLAGAHIAVVDDVMTTGATLDAAARVLKAAGARRVTNLVLFRTA